MRLVPMTPCLCKESRIDRGRENPGCMRGFWENPGYLRDFWENPGCMRDFWENPGCMRDFWEKYSVTGSTYASGDVEIRACT